ncbi:glypican-6-like protein [Leptotrombidium deliense]|uniref:Glypican-6-like protein n=1 Tax=Leptotrombidium deliense TaxID=299467 RepID=A0A443SV30_9ACAR|nr:glypican-6-like protein [Leptotrombidium deliense]
MTRNRTLVSFILFALLCVDICVCGVHALPSRAATHGNKGDLESILKETLNNLLKTLELKAEKFDEFFKELLKTSKRDFHQMFIQTYGLLYEQNALLFTDMFAELEHYYNHGGIDLSASLNRFFHRLYRKMFQVLNTQYSFDEKYLQCVGEHMDAMKPFGDVPKKLTIEVKRSFVATRTFVQSLFQGKEIIKNVMELSLTNDCGEAVMRLTQCTHCNESPNMKPCFDYCQNTTSSCLSRYSPLNKEWNNYVDAILLLITRLETSFNIESVVDPIDIRISEAIMNFQENGNAVSQKLFEACGKPRIGERAINDALLIRNKRARQNTVEEKPGAVLGKKFDRLLEDIQRKIKKTKDFWTKLPESVCSHPHFGGDPKQRLSNCWNGSDVSPYNSSKSAAVSPRSETRFAKQGTNFVITQQLVTLRVITSRLNYAFNGLEVEKHEPISHHDAKSDDNEEFSGSGSGSGDGDEDEDNSPEDVFVVNSGRHDIYFSSSTNPSSDNQPTSRPKIMPPHNYVPKSIQDESVCLV